MLAFAFRPRRVQGGGRLRLHLHSAGGRRESVRRRGRHDEPRQGRSAVRAGAGGDDLSARSSLSLAVRARGLWMRRPQVRGRGGRFTLPIDERAQGGLPSARPPGSRSGRWKWRDGCETREVRHGPGRGTGQGSHRSTAGIAAERGAGSKVRVWPSAPHGRSGPASIVKTPGGATPVRGSARS